MSTINIKITKKGLRQDAIAKLVTKLGENYPEAQVSVTVYEPPESRADRFAAAKTKLEEAKAEFEELKSELESWKENLPEGLQDGDKASQLDDAISELDSLDGNLDEAIGVEVVFPGMF